MFRRALLSRILAFLPRLMPARRPPWLRNGREVGIRFFGSPLRVGSAHVRRRTWSTAVLDNGLRVHLRARDAQSSTFLAFPQGANPEDGDTAAGLVTAVTDPVYVTSTRVADRVNTLTSLMGTLEAFGKRPTRTGADALMVAVDRYARAALTAEGAR